jgi:hypothetical protein
MTEIDVAAWDDDSWIVASDPPWRAGCRLLQARWREIELGLPPGPRAGGSDQRLVSSMLPAGADPNANFLAPEIARAVEARLAEGDHSGIIEQSRLRRNLLSSQPACFNLFGPFVDRPASLLGWVRSIDPHADTVVRIGFEWAPPRDRHFGGGSAFDAVVVYAAGTSTRMLGIECKYAEDLGESRIGAKADSAYASFTVESGRWRSDAVAALDQRRLRQLWLNTLLVQSCADREPEIDVATAVVVACADDVEARRATEQVQAQLRDRGELRWQPYEAVLDLIDEPDLAGWRGRFCDRYLRFDRVAHRLRPDDARRTPALINAFAAAADVLLTVGRRVTGEGSVLDQVATAELTSADSQALLDATARADRLAEELRALRAEPLFDLLAVVERPADG